MSKILCTFSGKFGDIVWSLATVRRIALASETSVDFGVMPQYAALVPLIRLQSYIDTACCFPDWVCTGSPFGDQPWCPPASTEQGYAKAYHLTYRYHPGALCLVDHIAREANYTVNGTPWLDICGQPPFPAPYIACGHNEAAASDKAAFAQRIGSELSLPVHPVNQMSWVDAALAIKHAAFFVGDMSALHVLAHGLGKRVLVYEPDPGRRTNPVYRFPHGQEQVLAPDDFAGFVRVGSQWLQSV